MNTVEEAPTITDSKKSKEELNKEINSLIDLAIKGDKEAGRRASKLAKILIRRG